MEIKANIKYRDGLEKEYVANSNEVFKRVFLKSLAYNMIGFVFNDGMVAFDCETIEEARSMDYSNICGCKTAEEAACNCCTEVYPFNENEWEEVIEL